MKTYEIECAVPLCTQQKQSNDPTESCFQTRRIVSEMEVLFTVSVLDVRVT